MITAMFLAAWPSKLVACAVCFGDPNSSMTQGMNVGIIALLMVSGMVLSAIGVFFFYLFKRSKMFIIGGPKELGILRMKNVRIP